MKKSIFLAAVLVVALGLAMGCGKASRPLAEEAAPATPGEAALAAAEDGLAAIRSGDLGRLYDLLPVSYQADLSRLVQTAVGKIDPDLFAAATGLLADAGEAVTAQAGHLAELAAEEGTPLSGAGTEEDFRAMGEWLAACGAGLSRDKLAAGDMSGLLSLPRAGAPLGLKLDSLERDWGADVSCELAPDGGEPRMEGVERLLFRAKSATAGEAETVVDFVQVEGKWIPLEMAREWPEWRDGAQALVDGFELDLGMKKTLGEAVPFVRNCLGAMKNAQSPKELEAQIAGMVAAFAFMGLF